MMLNKFSGYFILASISLTVIILCFLVQQKQSLIIKLEEENKKMRDSVTKQNTAINIWKAQSEEMKKKVVNANIRAEEIENKLNHQQKVYRQTNNKSCDDAAHWAAKVAPEILSNY